VPDGSTCFRKTVVLYWKMLLSLYFVTGITTIIASVVGTDKGWGREISKLEGKHEEGRSQRKKD